LQLDNLVLQVLKATRGVDAAPRQG